MTFGVASVPLCASEYRCAITRLDAAEKADEASDEFRSHIGKVFYVDTHSGQILGVFRSYGPRKPVVLHNGGPDRPFLAVTSWDPGSDKKSAAILSNVLRIELHHDGDEKPFVFLRTRTVYRGICRESSGSEKKSGL